MVMAFDKWETSEIKIRDLGLAKYINLDSKTFPHSFGRMAKKKFDKGNISIIERLMNKMMRSGQGKRKLSGKYIRGRGGCGKKLQVMEIVEKAFEIISLRTKENPVQILVKAIENAAPREDVTRVKKGGIVYSQAVDLAPLIRVDESLKNIAISAFAASFNKKLSAEQALADELILASKEDAKSFSVKRRDEVERIAKASR